MGTKHDNKNEWEQNRERIKGYKKTVDKICIQKKSIKIFKKLVATADTLETEMSMVERKPKRNEWNSMDRPFENWQKRWLDKSVKYRTKSRHWCHNQ